LASSYNQVLARNLSQALRKNDFEAAEALLERLKEEEPMALATRGLELELLIKQGNGLPARSLCDQLLRLHDGSSRIQLLAGELAYREKRYAQAANHFRESHRLHNHWRSRYWLGKALTQGGKLDEAQDILESLCESHSFILNDLAWLYERKNDLEKALATHETILKTDADNTYHRQQVERLKGLLLDPEELVEELATLEDLGEEIPQHLLPDFVSNLFKTGQGQRARDLIAEKASGFDHRLSLKVGWACYHAQAFDLAFDLFAPALPHNLKAFKFLNSLQNAARKGGRLEALKELYEQNAPNEPGLYGRLRGM